MSEQQTAEAPSTAVVARTSIVKVEAALAEFDAIEAGLTDLRTKYAGVVFDVKSAAGMKEAIAARAAVREPRYKTEHARKAGKAPVLTLGQNIQDRAAYITDELMQIEEPIHAQITAEEERRETEKQAKREAEQNRIAKIQAGIAEIRQFAIDAAGKSASEIAEAMEYLESYPVNKGGFAEFEGDAEQVKVATMNRLNAMHSAAKDREAAAAAEAVRLAAEQSRIKAESEELARRQAEQDAREKAEAARIAQEAQERAQAEAKAKAAIQAEEEAARARIQAQDSEARQIREEADRVARVTREQHEAAAKAEFEEQQAKLKAEADRLAKEREAAEARERKKQEAIEAKEKAKREKAEAAERARVEKEESARREAVRIYNERMDTLQMAEAFYARIIDRPEWFLSATAIAADLAAMEKAA